MLSPIREWFFLNFRQVILSFFSCELLSDIIFIAIFISEFRISEHDISITYLPFLHWTSIEIRRSSLNATFFISIRLWVSFLTTLFFIFVRHSIDLFIYILGWLPIFFMATDRLPTSFNMRSHWLFCCCLEKISSCNNIWLCKVDIVSFTRFQSSCIKVLWGCNYLIIFISLRNYFLVRTVVTDCCGNWLREQTKTRSKRRKKGW